MIGLTILDFIDTLFFVITSLTVLYLFIFAIAATIKRGDTYPNPVKKNRFAILFPCYQEDAVIESSIRSFLEQDYPKDKYDIVVISDHMKEETNNRLKQLPIILLEADYENSSKAKALNFAMEKLDESKYDIVVIMDADNTTTPDFLYHLNCTYAAGSNAIQAHRIAKNRNTNVAVLDAVSEEINNSIFRAGHVRLGFSSALIGSGMAFDYRWFKENIVFVASIGEDKEIEALLLKQHIYIEYLDKVYVYDQKTQKKEAFNKQRRRWMAAQYSSLSHAFPDLFSAIANRNFDYADKIIQWMMLPRIILIGLMILFGTLLAFINWEWSIKWWILLSLLILTFCIAIPNYLVDKQFTKAVKSVPILGIHMALNMFRLKGAKKKFIHTEHEKHI